MNLRKNIVMGIKNKVKTRLRLYHHFKEREDSGSDEDSYIESQETLMEELYDISKDIETTKIDCETAQAEKVKASKALSDITNSGNVNE